MLRRAFSHYFAERGTHLAAMVAYFALASFVPLVFLALALLGALGQADAEGALVSYLRDVFPQQPVDNIVSAVRAVEENIGSLTVVGSAALLWSSLSLFSSLESAFNVIWGRPNRRFVHGKLVAGAYMSVGLVVLFLALAVGTLGYDLLARYAGGTLGGPAGVALTLSTSAAGLFAFLLSAYERLTNAKLTLRQAAPGALMGAIVLALLLQALPLFVTLAKDVIALQALGATFLLLVYFYVLANVIVFGAALNYELMGRPRDQDASGGESV
ncbi:MAG: YihY/virulence factor BrkB family protein [Gaiella sp.]